MAAVARYLADTSALARLHRATVAERLGPLIEAGLVATCPAIDFEILWSTRSATEYRAARRDRAAGYEHLAIEDGDWHRALDVQERLWAAGSIRAVPMVDLLVAAVARRHRVTLLHYDADYDRIAAVTKQRTEWIVPAGSVP